MHNFTNEIDMDRQEKLYIEIDTVLIFHALLQIHIWEVVEPRPVLPHEPVKSQKMWVGIRRSPRKIWKILCVDTSNLIFQVGQNKTTTPRKT